MAGFNKVILMGNLTRNPELRYTPSGTAVTDLSVAVNTPRGRGADRKDDTVFVDVTVWDRQAETCTEYLAKGRPVLVEGRLRMDQWEDKETGKKRSKLAVVAQSVTFLGAGTGTSQDSARSAAPQSAASAANESLEDPFEGADDVPF
ncbi:MAG: single-stranded DNA-binding protein [Planctomycetota bacterium]|jgi:single-strand DNA-binding protein